MQFHYVVFYDTDTKKWGVEFDTAAYFPDGNVYDDDSATQTGYGWFAPVDSSTAAAGFDDQLVTLLGYIVDTWPAPGVVAHAKV